MDGGESDSEDEVVVRLRKGLHLRTEELSTIDEATARRVLRDYGRLVQHLARQYRLPNRSHSPVRLEDMIATGNAVLLQCWVAFDPERGVRFSSWASFILRRVFAELVREASGRSVCDVRRERDGLGTAKHIPTVLSLEDSTGPQSFHGEYYCTFADTIVDAQVEPVDDQVHRQRQLAWLRDAIAEHLTDRERHVVLALLDGVEPATIAEQLEVTRQRVDQLYRRAIEKLQSIADEDLRTDGAPGDIEPERSAFIVMFERRLRRICPKTQTAVA